MAKVVVRAATEDQKVQEIFCLVGRVPEFLLPVHLQTHFKAGLELKVGLVGLLQLQIAPTPHKVVLVEVVLLVMVMGMHRRLHRIGGVVVEDTH